jgi:hypothetical protein
VDGNAGTRGDPDASKKPVDFADVVDGLRAVGNCIGSKSTWAFLDSNVTVLNRAVAEIQASRSKPGIDLPHFLSIEKRPARPEKPPSNSSK